MVLAIDDDLHHRLRHDLDASETVETALDHHPKTVDREEFGDRAERAPREQLEAGIGALIGIAGGFAFLDDRDQVIELRIVLGNLYPAALQRVDEV
ncbi:hypothetical protein D3C86_1963820 [compost metagenome]